MKYSPSLNCLTNSAPGLNRNYKIRDKKTASKNLNILLRTTGLIITTVFIITVLVFSIETRVGSSEVLGSESYIQVTVKKGDTLWSIAKEHGDESQDIRKVCESIREANNINDNILVPGQSLLVPKSA